MAKDDFTCGSLDIAIIGMSGRFSRCGIGARVVG
ncbi:malonyl CoA-acyl carrier protein transacylase [Klebsiella pneumoniae]|uniref:Malonyl CoA-acyl carrier protein transacylase n=1 Tax=Klebsiella pneumoniae TaxID=573 RepID=A0A378ARQ0_KLEPN|nr:malonyl CoA-acyl carrier protein transacylase [Klebsiella pneumoniae]